MALGWAGQQEDHRERRFPAAATLRSSRSQTDRRKGGLDRSRRPQVHPVLGRKVVASQQHLAVFLQALNRLGELLFR